MTTIPEVVAAEDFEIVEVLPASEPNLRRRGQRGALRALLAGVGALFGWVWRVVVGALFCMSYFSSILVVGWTYRWMQGVVLRGWWKQSRFRHNGAFSEYCESFGPDAPVLRPRWILQERVGAALTRPGPDGGRPGKGRVTLRYLLVPWSSLWLNLKVGVQALFCTYLFTGWGLLLFSWEFGWLNSFVKGYEQAAVGPLTGFLGIALFIAAMFYVPMAQVHQATTGDYRAFFDFRFVWRLIQAKPLAYVGLAAFVTVVSLPLEVLKTAPAFFDGHFDSWTNASDAEVLQMLRTYLFACCLVLFPALLLARLVAASTYRSAVLKALRSGLITHQELHPILARWMDQLEIRATQPAVSAIHSFSIGSVCWWLVGAMDLAVFVMALLVFVTAGPVAVLALLGSWIVLTAVLAPLLLLRRGGLPQYLRSNGRRLVFVALVWIWFGFVAQVYVGEFFNRHPAEGLSPDAGFMNRVLVQFPCFDFVPAKLQQSASR